MPREVWTSAGAQGLLGTDMEERLGGGGVRDFGHRAVIDEELLRIGATGVGSGLHNDVAGRTCATCDRGAGAGAGAGATLVARLLPR